MSSASSALERFRPKVETELRACLADDGIAPRLYGMIRYHLGWVDARFQPSLASGGKLLRPILCLLAAEAVGADYHRALPAAAALELVHNFSLIHDDVMDRSAERHHRPTVWSIWGDAQAIDVGDAALILAELAFLRSLERGVELPTVAAGARLLNRACLRLAEGQHLDVSFEGRLDVTAEDYLTMVSGKTAALLGCSLALGALVGSNDLTLAERYGEVGEQLGLAFQVQDDLLGIWGKPERTGKPVADDVYQRKMTLPVIHALTHADPAERQVLADIYGSPALSPEQVARAITVMEKAGARAYAEEVASRHYAAAMVNLDALGAAEQSATALREVVSFLTSRDY